MGWKIVDVQRLESDEGASPSHPYAPHLVCGFHLRREDPLGEAVVKIRFGQSLIGADDRSESADVARGLENLQAQRIEILRRLDDGETQIELTAVLTAFDLDPARRSLQVGDEL